MIHECAEKKYNFQCVTHVCFQCYLVLYAESMQPFIKLKRESWSFTQVAPDFPSTNCMQSTDNKHSISQREKRACTSLFCFRRKSKDTTLMVSQNWGYNMRAAQIFQHLTCSSLWLWLHCPQFIFALDYAKKISFPSTYELTYYPEDSTGFKTQGE